MSRISDESWGKTQEKTEENNFVEGHWPVYEPETYQLFDMEGFRYIWTEEPHGEAFREEVKSIAPLSTEYAGLFLEFARWFDNQKMDKGVEWVAGEPRYGATLDTARNGDAALAWARRYGVLGLGRNSNSSFSIGNINSSSSQIAAERLGMPRTLGHSGTRAYRKSTTGGKHETVERFVLEAQEANVVLKLYELAAAKTVNVPAIARFMSNSKRHFASLPKEYRRVAKTERQDNSQDADSARSWALAVVEGTVARKVEEDVYSLLTGKPRSYEEAWGFKSLLGAMWFQMRRFMLGESDYDYCLRCGERFPKTRRDRFHCGDSCSGKARAAKAYERKKQREKEVREARRRKLRR